MTTEEITITGKKLDLSRMMSDKDLIAQNLIDVGDCKAGTVVIGMLFVKDVFNGVTRGANKPFVKVTMTDGLTEIDGMIWDSTDIIDGNAIAFCADVKTYQEGINLTLKQYVVGSIDEEFFPTKAIDLEDIIKELELYNKIQDVEYAAIVKHFIFNNKTPTNPFFRIPAGRKMHHSYRVGLAEHTLEVVRNAYALARVNQLNMDLCLAGAYLHDIGKIKIYSIDGFSITYNKQAGMQEHLYIGIRIIEDFIRENLPNMSRAKIDLLINIIGSHHGELEWGALFEPNTREAYAVHLADMMSSRLNVMNIKSEVTDEEFIDRKTYGMFRTFINNNEVSKIINGKMEISTQKS